jgi:hypothetical protein
MRKALVYEIHIGADGVDILREENVRVPSLEHIENSQVSTCGKI